MRQIWLNYKKYIWPNSNDSNLAHRLWVRFDPPLLSQKGFTFNDSDLAHLWIMTLSDKNKLGTIGRSLLLFMRHGAIINSTFGKLGDRLRCWNMQLHMTCMALRAAGKNPLLFLWPKDCRKIQIVFVMMTIQQTYKHCCLEQRTKATVSTLQVPSVFPAKRSMSAWKALAWRSITITYSQRW